MIEQDVDWSVLEYPGVKAVAKKAASKVAADYANLPLMDFDDLLQEAYLNLATRPEVVRKYIEGPDGTGGLYHDLLMNLIDKVRPEVERHHCQGTDDPERPAACGSSTPHDGHPRSCSYDALLKVGQDAPKRQVSSEPQSPSRGYTRELIERLLPAVWDNSYAYGMTNPYAPDPDMPRGSVDVSHGCTLYAYLADIRWAWRKAYIPIEEKQALLLRYGMGWREREIAEQQGVDQTTAGRRITRGVGRLRDYLNGVEFSEQRATM